MGYAMARPLYREHELAFRTQYAELKERTLGAGELLAGTPGSLAWAAFGAALRNFLRDPVKVRWFNLIMALLLVASLYPAVSDLLWR
jgi:threonine/homoserine/homoserine lactone efflux protein